MEENEKKNPDNWAVNIRKKARSQGLEYEYKTINKEVKTMPQRTMKSAYDSTCRQTCSSKFTNEQRRAIFARYWECESNEEKRLFISKLVKKWKSREDKVAKVNKEISQVCTNIFLTKEMRSKRLAKYLFKTPLA